jgi:hypothetical protein
VKTWVSGDENVGIFLLWPQEFFWFLQVNVIFMPPLEDCFAAVCQLVGMSVHQQFSFIFFALVARTEM